MFTKLVNNRLSEWGNDEEKLSDFQAGFRTGKSVTDHVFVLQSMIRKYLGKKGERFYSIFVDFSKAFDSVPHKHLFYKLFTG